ncbi:nuclear transport factor 2 family protein [Streptosporangium sp. CA-135522]|uniref:nuclear transport factor 2 family protein n=1 Tax=Streptosporangium sp. CA-135522 TaxID=3240072 RepID=UPI003D8CA209
MTVIDPKAVVVRYVEAVRDGDLATIRASFAEDATWDYPGDVPLSRTWRGRDAIVDDFLGGTGALLRPGTPVLIELTNVIGEGEQVVAEWRSQATTRSGGAYDNRCLGVFTVRGGEIISVREYADTQHVEHVLFAASPAEDHA